ncbi:hypothetical protein [Streptomyces minutiscleroticus]|uniref:Uncharacterized protein n=1 Tax=Streptomyces minutiscleroticus TaxID=68238 RepID=A0A918NW26_9ACTN|nr:hypothetical protein [Streptomyces minutiscleroticus]GGY00957.1 hypothetical protein GCM10010358_63640 [Streptomyces minutiscleroticus]
MRWLVLHARSRQVPASAAAVLAAALAVWFLAADGGSTDPRLSVLALTGAVAAASVGLGGQDVALDRTAAVRWVPRRAAHVLAIGAVAAGALLTVRAAGADLGTASVLLRNSAGLTGLAAAGAVLCGAAYAWTLPLGWLAPLLFAPPAPEGPMQVLTWMTLPPHTAAATWTALVLGVAGTVAYAVVGPRH